MSQHVLGQFLSSSGVFFDKMIADFERSTGDQAIDVNLIGEVLTQTNLRIRALRLEPGDTSAMEMYQALLARYTEDAAKVRYQLMSEDLDLDLFRERLLECLSSSAEATVCRLKSVSLAKLLAQHPPTQTLKRLKLTKVEQLMGDYTTAEVLVAVRLLESSGWLASWMQSLAKLSPKDYELALAEIVLVEDSELRQILWQKFANRPAVAAALGGALLWANELTVETIESSLDLILELSLALDKLITTSNQLQLILANKSYSQNLAKFLNNSTYQTWTIADNPVPWWSIFKAMARPGGCLNQAVTKRYPKLELTSFRPITNVVETFDLKFWLGNSFLAFKNARDIVSLNLTDVAINHRSPSSRTFGVTSGFEEALWNELVARYLDHEGLAEQILLQL